MYRNTPLKTKTYIFIVLSVVVIGIVAFVGIQNYKLKARNTEAGTKLENEKKQKDEQTIFDEKKSIQEEDKKNLEKLKQTETEYQKGYEAFMNKQYSMAISIENDVIAKDSTNYKAYNVKGIAICFSNHNSFNEGMSFIDKALELSPDYDYARFNKALANELCGHYQVALQLYDKALQIKSPVWTVWSYYGKASIYGRYGDVKHSVENLKIAIGMESAIKGFAAKEVDFTNVKGSKEFQDLLK